MGTPMIFSTNDKNLKIHRPRVCSQESQVMHNLYKGFITFTLNWNVLKSHFKPHLLVLQSSMPLEFSFNQMFKGYSD